MPAARFVHCLVALVLFGGATSIAGEKKREAARLAPSVREAALHEVLKTADRVEIRRPRSLIAIHKVAGTDVVTKMLEAIEIEDAKSGHYCACNGDFHLHFFVEDRPLAVVGYHHSRSLRWHGGSWEGDSELTPGSREKLIAWFSAHGFAEPAREREQELARAAAARQREEIFANCFQESSRGHLKYADFPDLRHDEKTQRMGQRLVASYADPVACLRDICRAYGTRPVPWNSYGYADQIGRAAAWQLPPEVYRSLLADVGALDGQQKAGFSSLVRTHPDLNSEHFDKLHPQLIEVLEGALATAMDADDLSPALLWFEKSRIAGTADALLPFVSGERQFLFRDDARDIWDDPPPLAVAALVMALLGDERVIEHAEARLEALDGRSPEQGTLRLALAHAKGEPKLFSIDDYDWQTRFQYRAVNHLAHRFPSKHTYDLVILGVYMRDGGDSEQAVIEFEKLTGQKWYQGRSNERALWHLKKARDWWLANRDTFEFPKGSG